MTFVPKEIYSVPVEEREIIKKNSTEKPEEGRGEDVSKKPKENDVSQTNEKPLKGAKVIFMGDSFDVTIRKFNLPPGSVVRNPRRR